VEQRNETMEIRYEGVGDNMQVGDLVRTIPLPDQHHLPPRMGILLEVDVGYHPVMVLWFDGTKRSIPWNRLEVVCK